MTRGLSLLRLRLVTLILRTSLVWSYISCCVSRFLDLGLEGDVNVELLRLLRFGDTGSEF